MSSKGWEAHRVGGTHPGSQCANAALIPGSLGYGLRRAGYPSEPGFGRRRPPERLFNSTREERRRNTTTATPRRSRLKPTPPRLCYRETPSTTYYNNSQYDITIILRTPLQAPPRPHTSCRGSMWPGSAIAIAACVRKHHANCKHEIANICLTILNQISFKSQNLNCDHKKKQISRLQTMRALPSLKSHNSQLEQFKCRSTTKQSTHRHTCTRRTLCMYALAYTLARLPLLPTAAKRTFTSKILPAKSSVSEKKE